MADLTLLNTIPAVSLTGNKIPLKFRGGDNYYQEEGSTPSITFPFISKMESGDNFEILFLGKNILFTAVAAPDNSGNQITVGDNFVSVSGWIAQVAVDMARNYYMNRYCNIYAGSDYLTIEAKICSSIYDFELGVNNIGSRLDGGAQFRGGSEPVYAPFYNIGVQLIVGGIWQTELLLNVDSAGFAEVDISKIIEANLSPQFTFPFEANSMYNREGNLVAWTFNYYERWGTDNYSAVQESELYYGMLGGLSWMQQAKYNRDGTNFFERIQYNQYFLSWAPLIRHIKIEEPVKLYFLTAGLGGIWAYTTVYYPGGSEKYGIAGAELYPVDVSEIGFSVSGIEDSSIMDKTATHIEVWMEDMDGNRVSEIRTYYIDYNEYEHERYFMFRNSLGAYEILRTTGIIKKTDEYEREVSTIDSDTDYTSNDRVDLSVSNKERQKFTLSAGWLGKVANAAEYRNWLRDFSLSKEVWQVIGSTLKPVRIISSSIDHGKDRDNAHGFTFEYVNAFTDEHYTKEITWNIFNESYATDFEKAQ